jgi:hypothetical protein
MTKETPVWLQGGTYPARLDRYFVEEVMRRQNRVFRGLLVSQRAGGATQGIDVSAGSCAILGTSQADQGMYFMRSTAVEQIGPGAAFPPTPGANRTDTVIAHVNDPQAGGAAGNNWTIEVIPGGTSLPTNCLVLATIARTPSEPSILNAAITDMRPLGEWAWTVSTTAPGSTRGVPGDLWVVCP